MKDENSLRAKARAALRAGRLPNEMPERIWAGPGTGARCAVCDEPIERAQSEFDLQFAGPGNGEPVRVRAVLLGEWYDPSRDKPRRSSYHVHTRCFAAWEFER